MPCSTLLQSTLLPLLAAVSLAAQTGAPSPSSAPAIGAEEYAARRLSGAPREPAEIESAMAHRGH